MAELENKQYERFCREYITHFNGARAARDAGYSEKAAKEQASLLLTKANIQERIAELTKPIHDKLEITAERIKEEMAAVAFSRLDDVATWDSQGRMTIKSPEDIPEALKPAIKQVVCIEFEGGCKYLVEFWDKMKALEMLAKHLRMYTDQAEGDNITNNIVYYMPDNGRDPELMEKLKKEGQEDEERNK